MKKGLSIKLTDRNKRILDMIEADLPNPTNSFGGVVTESVKMRDGIELSTKIYFPSEGKEWPCIFMRTPYTNFIELLTVMCLPFVKFGYVLVVQGCRGTCGSGGEWDAFLNEREDGIDALNWLAKQEWHDGNIGLYGKSYQGYTQWIIGDSLPKEVKTMYIENFGVDRYKQMYMNGMFRQDIYTAWSLDNSGIAHSRPLSEIYEEALSIKPHNEMDTKLLGEKIPFYQDYISKVSRNEPYWKDGIWGILKDIPSKINVPICVVAGWFDHHLDGTLLGYNKLSESVKQESVLIVGPWDHGSQSPGDLDYLGADKFGASKVKIAFDWFEYMLKDNESADKPKSEFYIVQDSKWEEKDFYEVDTEYLQLQLTSERKLLEEANKDKISYLYKPSEPVVTSGGSALLAWSLKVGNTPHGSVVQQDYKDRDDVISFISEDLKEPLEIIGSIEVTLYVSSDCEDTCFTAKVCEEMQDGKTYNIADGASSIKFRNETPNELDYIPEDRVKLKIKMWDTAWTLQKNSRLKLIISSSNFPAYHVHSNISGCWSSISDEKTATQNIFVGNEWSQIRLPIRKKEV